MARRSVGVVTATRPRSIPTLYGSTEFRSKLEADWARFFDKIGLKWRYEVRGMYFGDVFYYPDFYLPDSQQYVEVKGVWAPADCRKVAALLQYLPPRLHTSDSCPDIPIIACNPDGKWWGYRRPGSADLPLNLATLLLELNMEVALYQCLRCRGWWFAVEEWSWKCQCCGAYDGNGFLGHALYSSPPGWPVKVEVW